MNTPRGDEPIVINSLKKLQKECQDLAVGVQVFKREDKPTLVAACYKFGSQRLMNTFNAWHEDFMKRELPGHITLAYVNPNTFRCDYFMCPNEEMAQEVTRLLAEDA